MHCVFSSQHSSVLSLLFSPRVFGPSFFLECPSFKCTRASDIVQLSFLESPSRGRETVSGTCLTFPFRGRETVWEIMLFFWKEPVARSNQMSFAAVSCKRPSMNFSISGVRGLCIHFRVTWWSQCVVCNKLLGTRAYEDLCIWGPVHVPLVERPDCDCSTHEWVNHEGPPVFAVALLNGRSPCRRTAWCSVFSNYQPME